MTVNENQTDDSRVESHTEEPTSMGRRKLMRFGGIAAAGAAAAAIAGVMDAEPAGASDGANLVVGSYGNTAENPTQLVYDAGSYQGNGYFGIGVGDVSPPSGWASGTPAIAGYATGAHFNAGVQGVGTGSAIGVLGTSVNGEGVQGIQGAGSTIATVAAVVGTSQSADGVAGLSDSGNGVLAAANGDASALVARQYGPGWAITATSVHPGATQPALEATSTTPVQSAIKANGASLPASSGVGAGNAAALDVHGRAAFTRSGVLTIPAGATNALTPLVAGGLLATSHVLATIQENKGTVTVRAAVPITVGANKGKIQVFLTGAVPASPVGGLKVAWFVFG